MDFNNWWEDQGGNDGDTGRRTKWGIVKLWAKTTWEDRQEVIEQKDQRIKELEDKLKVAVDALSVYGNTRNWGHVCENDLPDFQLIDDLEEVFNVDDYYRYGGRAAREALKKIGELK